MGLGGNDGDNICTHFAQFASFAFPSQTFGIKFENGFQKHPKMNKLILFLSFTLLIQVLKAQSNAIFFTDNGEKFYVILNGLKYNDQAQTNVKVENLKPQAYSAKIIFENTALGAIDDKIWLDFGKERTYQIRRKKVRDAGVEREVYVMKWMSEIFIQNPNPNPNPANVGPNTNTINQPQTYTPPPPPPAQTVQTTTTTTTYENVNPNGVNVNVNVPGFGFNMNVNDPNYYPPATTTTTVQQTHTTIVNPQIQQPINPILPANNPPVYVMPGYNGPVGCSWPANQQDFQSMKSSIASKSFEDTKLQVAKQILNSNCLTSSQVREVMDVFSFESSKLDFAKYAYGYTFDIGNYYKVNDAFTFSSSIDDLNSYIQGR